MESVWIDGQLIRIKVSAGRVKAEYEDVALAARRTGQPLAGSGLPGRGPLAGRSTAGRMRTEGTAPVSDWSRSASTGPRRIDGRIGNGADSAGASDGRPAGRRPGLTTSTMPRRRGSGDYPDRCR